MARITKNINNIYNRFVGKHEKAFKKLKEDYTDMCLKFEFVIIEREEKVEQLKQCLEDVFNKTKSKEIKKTIMQTLQTHLS